VFGLCVGFFQLAMFTSVAGNTTKQTYVSCMQSWHQ